MGKMSKVHNVRFCWLCSNKLYGNHKEELSVDGHVRTLHKACAKEIKREYDFIKRKDGYHSIERTPSKY